MLSIDEEHRALIGRIVSSEIFTKSPGQIRLLEFLFQHRSEGLQAKEIEELHYGHPIDGAKNDPAHTRERVAELRGNLKEFTECSKGERWVCILESSRAAGYLLKFERAQLRALATELFWQPHLNSASDVLVVTGSHLFFYDPAIDEVFRFYDLNNRDGESDEVVLKRLKAKGPEFSNRLIEPLQRYFMSSGEVYASDALQRWFHEKAGVLIRRQTSRETPERQVHESLPILLGRPAANSFIHRYFNSPAFEKFAYRIHEPMGAIRIIKPTTAEKKALTKFGITKDGVVRLTSPRRQVFGIFTRMRNPSGFGHITIISADYQVRVITQIVEALTQEKYAAQLLSQTGWSLEADLPDEFEMLFSVTLSPGGLEGEGKADLIACRPKFGGSEAVDSL